MILFFIMNLVYKNHINDIYKIQYAYKNYIFLLKKKNLNLIKMYHIVKVIY